MLILFESDFCWWNCNGSKGVSRKKWLLYTISIHFQL